MTQEKERVRKFQKSLKITTPRQQIISNLKSQINFSTKKEKKNKKTLHNTSVGFYIDVDSFPSLNGKISDRFDLFFHKFRTKILFQDQDIYKVSLSKLVRVLRIMLKFSCSGIIDDTNLNIFEEKLGIVKVPNDLSDIHIKTKRTSLMKSTEKPKKAKEFTLTQEESRRHRLTQVNMHAGTPPKPQSRCNEESLLARQIRENSNTPKKKRHSGGSSIKAQVKRPKNFEQESADDTQQLNLFEEYTFILQPFLCFIHSIHRIVFFLDYNDKCTLYKNIFKSLNTFLNEFFFVSELQSKLYRLKTNLQQLKNWDGSNLEDFSFLKDAPNNQSSQANFGNRSRTNTTDIVGVYNNEGIKYLPKEMVRKKVARDTRVRLKSISSFPYLLTLLVDLEQLFSEQKQFFISLNQESFFEKIGILSEIKMKNKKRIHR